MQIDYLFPIGNKTIGNENVCSSQHCTHFILPSETWISIHNDRNCPIFDNYENGIIRNSLYTFHFLLKGADSCSRLLINFKYNNYIQDKKLVSEEGKMDVMVIQWKAKSNSPFRSFVKSFCTLTRNFNTFPWASNSRKKSRVRKSENFQER